MPKSIKKHQKQWLNRWSWNSCAKLSRNWNWFWQPLHIFQDIYIYIIYSVYLSNLIQLCCFRHGLPQHSAALTSTFTFAASFTFPTAFTFTISYAIITWYFPSETMILCGTLVNKQQKATNALTLVLHQFFMSSRKTYGSVPHCRILPYLHR